MKTIFQMGLRTVFLYSALQFPQLVFAQNSIQGKWSGTFMDQFQVSIIINQADNTNLEGKLSMYAGENMIQNDDLSDIQMDQKEVKFYIPAKETTFNGVLNSAENEISGNFVFPDGSRHALVISKSSDTLPEGLADMDTFLEMRSKIFPGAQLQEDLNFIKARLEENHPQLYTYTDKAIIDKAFEKAHQSTIRGMNLPEFYLLAAHLTEIVKCSHTGLKMPGEYEDLAKEFDNYFPFKLYFSSDKAYILEDGVSSETGIESGSEILSINDLSISEIREKIFNIIPVEGFNSSTKYFEINKNFLSYFNLLDNSETYELELKEPGKSSISRVRIPAKSYYGIFPHAESKKNSRPLHFKVDDSHNLAILTIDDFTFSDINRYIDELDQIFLRINEDNIENLAIDLRGNQGGHPIFAAQLLSYLVNHEFTYFKRNPDILELEPLYNPMPANPIHYSGKVYALVNGGCLSTTGHLISLLQFYDLSDFIGEEPGSTAKCNDFSIQFTLPNTRIDLNVPRTTFETVAAEVSKEYYIKDMIEVRMDVIKPDRDPYMEKLYEIIENNHSQ